jgi:peptidoglycan/xylan/chitin deacetylase (PgdA/CDA1 family)
VLRSGPDGCHAVALTFDLVGAAASGWDRSLVDFLESQHVPATFFASGRWIATHDAEVRQLLAVPFFELGTHGQRHVTCRRWASPASGSRSWGHRPPVIAIPLSSTLFRAPYGEFDDHTRAIVADSGLRLVSGRCLAGDPDRS